MSNLLIALDRFLEAARRISKDAVLRPVERRLEAAMMRWWRVQERIFLRGFERLRPLFVEALREAVSDADWDAAFSAASQATQGGMSASIDEAAAAALQAGAEAFVFDIEIGISFDLANPRAVAYLRNHGAARVAGIDATTRDYIRSIITEGVDKGWSYNRTAEAISDRYTEFRVGQPQKHIASRAHLVAVTEAGEAYEAGGNAMVQDLASAGIPMEKSWLVTGGNICPFCAGNAGEGWIPLEQAFSSGVDHALAHVACRCATLYRVKMQR